MMRSRSFTYRLLALALGGVLILGLASNTQPRVFLVGDSTMADKPIVGNPEVGWGQVFPEFFQPGTVTVENHARNGRSTKSFIDEGLWQRVIERARPGDYVFIQFGHNDAKKEDSTRYAEPRGAYRTNLIRFVREAKAKGAIPVLITPVNRRKFDKQGAFVDTHGEYPAVVREVAREEATALIDLHAKSMKLFEREGEEGTKKYFLAGVPEDEYTNLPALKRDNTHFTKFGAVEIAKLVADGMREAGLPLAGQLKPAGDVKFPALKKIVGLDNYFNDETKTVGSKTVGFHYVWQDTANSGFSELGRLFDRQGAECDTLRQAPSAANLKRFGVYIIVDPDTPLESPAPHYMDPLSADALYEWVKAGGVLVLLENDKGNSEFEHFNTLSEKFGIHFNEDSYHHVEGTMFDQGKSDVFPDHPLFKGVKKIYMKEVSSITVTKPAEALLTENGIVLMATAEVGKGMVFAVGDPWLYNEYIDNRKLPVSFENYKAAQNLVTWLLGHAADTRK
jgi:lysophospholipase L1-like esterase